MPVGLDLLHSSPPGISRWLAKNVPKPPRCGAQLGLGVSQEFGVSRHSSGHEGTSIMLAWNCLVWNFLLGQVHTLPHCWGG